MSREKQEKKGYIPTTAERGNAPDQFLYELNMFRNAVWAHIRCRTNEPASTMILKNVTLESLLVHVRNLYDFFYGSVSKKDDIRAYHFINGGGLWQPSTAVYLSDVREKIHKHLSHLTYRRVAEKPAWDCERMVEEIERAYSEFLKALPDEEKDKWTVKGE